MSNLSNLVDECDDVFLEHLCAESEVVNEAETEDRVSFLPRHHRIHITTGGDVVGNNGRASIAEAKCQQVTNLLNSLLKNGRLHVRILFFFLFLALMHVGVDAC